MLIETRRQNTDAPQSRAQERRTDPFPAPLLALALCACVGSGALLALLIVMVT
jgi:hypothetical protein